MIRKRLQLQAGAFGIELIVLIALMSATAAFFLFFDRYQISGPELLQNPDFEDGLAGWRRAGKGQTTSGDDGVLRIALGERKKQIKVSQEIENNGYRVLRLSAQLRSQGVDPGRRRWERARLALVELRDDGLEGGIHIVAALTGDTPWERYLSDIEITGNPRSFKVMAQILHASGAVEIRHLSLRPVTQQRSYDLYRHIATALWGIFALWLAWRQRRHLGRTPAHLLLYIVVIATMAGVLLPDEVKRPIEDRIASSLPEAIQERMVISEPGQPLVFDFRVLGKTGHVLFFALLAFLLPLTYHELRPPHVFAGLLLLAVASELLQFFVDGRTPDPFDIVRDCGGAAAGLGLFLLWRRTTQR